MKEFVTNSVEETKALASKLSIEIEAGTVLGFLGDLGSGKTAFTSGFVKGLGIESEVSSPTFAICNEYEGGGKKVYHYDMYRIESWDDLYSVGFFDAVGSGAYVLCEWSENIFGALEDDAVIIKIEKLDENKRRITLMNKNEVSS